MKTSNKVLIIILFCFLFLNFFQKQTKSFFYNISSPIQNYFWQKGQGFFSYSRTIIKISSFKERMEILEKENRELKIENIFLKELEKENQTLKDAFKIGLEKEFQLSLVRVISKQNDFLLINQGKKQGIKENLLVITQEKVLVGKIIEVFDNQAKIMMITHQESSFEGEILEKNITGLVSGKNLNFVSVEKEVEKGDIITSGKFLVGKVSQVIKKDVEPFLTINIEPDFDIGSLNYLFIIND
ncbi:MAG: rod shape-determining protein MreC [Candidatus Pacebacteria bacterium]|nr:rod shape-determining protein MreC [Candidatus Paceibacterota bacterium]